MSSDNAYLMEEYVYRMKTVQRLNQDLIIRCIMEFYKERISSRLKKGEYFYIELTVTFTSSKSYLVCRLKLNNSGEDVFHLINVVYEQLDDRKLILNSYPLKFKFNYGFYKGSATVDYNNLNHNCFLNKNKTNYFYRHKLLVLNPLEDLLAYGSLVKYEKWEAEDKTILNLTLSPEKGANIFEVVHKEEEDLILNYVKVKKNNELTIAYLDSFMKGEDTWERFFSRGLTYVYNINNDLIDRFKHHANYTMLINPTEEKSLERDEDILYFNLIEKKLKTNKMNKST